MARAFPQSQPHDHEQEQPQGEWQALRGELVALLDQVETQVARTSRQDRAYPGLAERMRELRYQVGESEPDDRHREALRSVKRAVARFTDRDEPGYPAEQQAYAAGAPGYPPNPRDSLQSAIQQIRSRQMEMAPPQAQQRAPELPHLDEMARAVDGISGRLERLEAELKAQARGQNGNVKEIADQVGQLSHVVELLAGAVGETGQVKRLEGQIASLAKLVAQGPQVDLSALTQRLDDVSATVGRLADLQVQFANRVENPAASLKDGMASIETGVRNIYDRIDAIEKHEALSPEMVERLTDEMARITEALSHPAQPEGLVELVEALNSRIADIESRHADVGGLKADVQELRSAVIDAMEPRFAALELQIEALSDRVAERPADISIGQLEAQVRQLVARMDQTGEQLTGLARLQSQQELAPDLEALADLVAIRTSQAVAQSGTAATSGLSDEGLDEIEARMSRVVKAANARDKESDDFSGVRESIDEVNARLARLEASLTSRAREAERIEALPAEEATLPVDSKPVAPPPAAAPKVETNLPAEALPLGVPKLRSDAMPANPAEDAPLVDKPFADAGPVRAALEAKNGPRMRHPGLGDQVSVKPPESEPAPKPAGQRPDFDPASVARPPRPESSLDTREPEPFAAEPAGAPMPVAAETPVVPAAPASTNTFIAAARRAAQRQQGARPEVASNSLIARAFQSFQSGRKSPDAAEAKPSKPAKPARMLAGDKQARTEWKPEEEAPAPAPIAASPNPSIDTVGDQSAQPDLIEKKKPGFLRRHSKVILLGVSLVVLSLLTLNLINQRMAADRAGPAAPQLDAAPGDTGALGNPLSGEPVANLSTLPKAARVIPMVDSLATASIDPVAAKGFEPSTAIPAMPQAFTVSAKEPAGAAAAATEQVAELPPLASTVAPLADAIEPPASPVKVEPPPETLGPEALRQAAADGDPRAQFEIAAIYTEGRAVPEDIEAAAVWYERAAAQGFAPAQYRLGNLYENGRGVEKDLEQARLWYQRAAEAGNRMSMHNLAALYAGGEMGEQAFDSAAEWFEQAAQRGLKDSQFNLGMLHARGLGVPQDLEQSYKWFSIAAGNGDTDAAKARDDVARSLDAEAVGRLNAEVEAWKPAPIDLPANFAPIGTWSDKFDPGETIANQDVVKSVQMALTVLGYDVGTPDGLAGPKTAEAIKAFERSTGMSESGAINPRLLAVLGSQPV
jgi:localization factor PodJL